MGRDYRKPLFCPSARRKDSSEVRICSALLKSSVVAVKGIYTTSWTFFNSRGKKNKGGINDLGEVMGSIFFTFVICKQEQGKGCVFVPFIAEYMEL